MTDHTSQTDATYTETTPNRGANLQIPLETGSQTRTCGRCGDSYERYLIFFHDQPSAQQDHLRIEDEFGTVCRDCRATLADPGGYSVTDFPDTNTESGTEVSTDASASADD